MAGYTAIYCVGGAGENQAADGINSILFQIWLGNGSQRRLEVCYFQDGIQPLGNIRTLFSKSADEADMLLDACLAFFPQHFESCPSITAVRNALRDAEHLDFEGDTSAILPLWNRLRSEAAPLLAKLFIVKGELRPVSLQASAPATDLTVGFPETLPAGDRHSASPASQPVPASAHEHADGLPERHPEPAPHVESLHAPDDIGNDASLELFGDHDRGEDVGPVG